jgi:hypothetical protein
VIPRSIYRARSSRRKYKLFFHQKETSSSSISVPCIIRPYEKVFYLNQVGLILIGLNWENSNFEVILSLMYIEVKCNVISVYNK